MIKSDFIVKNDIFSYNSETNLFSTSTIAEKFYRLIWNLFSMGASFDFDSGIKHQQSKKQGGKASFRNTKV